MITIRRILCPTDFSEFSSRALAHALPLAKWYEATIAALHVYNFVAPPPTKMPTLAIRPHLSSEIRKERLRALIPEGAREWCRPEAVVASGRAYRGIVNVADERRADLIVMGVTGRGQMNRMLFGSTTTHVVHEATCPVLTIRTV
jgi:nucleotide-binding universal stress UspA family protein